MILQKNNKSKFFKKKKLKKKKNKFKTRNGLMKKKKKTKSKTYKMTEFMTNSCQKFKTEIPNSKLNIAITSNTS